MRSWFGKKADNKIKEEEHWSNSKLYEEIGAQLQRIMDRIPDSFDKGFAANKTPRYFLRGIDAGTQAEQGDRDWSSFDLGRAMTLLNSRNEAVIKKTLRRLHIRFWHAPAATMDHLLKAAWVPPQALNMV